MIANLRPGQWLELPNTKIRSVLPPVKQIGNPINIVQAWSGATVDTKRSRMLIWGGGHNDYYGNEMYALDLPSLSMKRIIDPSPTTSQANCLPELPDGTPTSRHTYDGMAYIAHADAFMSLNGGIGPCGIADQTTWTYNFATGKWAHDPSISPATYGRGTMTAYDAATKQVFVKDQRYFFSYSVETGAYTKLNTEYQAVDYHLSATIDPKRRQFVMVGNGVQVIDLNTYKMTTLNTTNAPELVTSQHAPGVAYDPVADRIVAWRGGSEVWALNMDTGVWTQVATNAGPTTPAYVMGVFGRWDYIPAYKVFVLVNSIDENAWVFRLAK